MFSENCLRTSNSSSLGELISPYFTWFIDQFPLHIKTLLLNKSRKVSQYSYFGPNSRKLRVALFLEYINPFCRENESFVAEKYWSENPSAKGWNLWSLCAGPVSLGAQVGEWLVRRTCAPRRGVQRINPKNSEKCSVQLFWPNGVPDHALGRRVRRMAL